jgi:hypothetical protein
MGHHGRQAQTERTDHVVWPDGSNSPKTFLTLNLTWPTLATVHTTLPPQFHLAVMVSRVESLNQVHAIVLMFYRFGKKSVTPAVFRRLMKELNELRTNPPEGIRVVTNEDNMLDVTGIIEGPGEWWFLED